MLFIGFDPKGMTDQELLNKTMDIHKRLAYASRFSRDGNLVDQLRSLADACAFEAQERASLRQFEILNKNRKDEKSITPDVTVADDKTNSADKTGSVKRENVFRANRSSRPIKE